MSGTEPLEGQLALDLGEVVSLAPLRPDLAWHHCRVCACDKPWGSPRCGSCPFTVNQLGRRRPSNRDLGLVAGDYGSPDLGSVA